MKKKYQVFISSTYIDLKEERQAVVEAVLKAGHIPAGMELFKSGKSQLETIKKWIDVSDIYVLILGGRYGSIDEETGKSYTQLEYEYALDRNMPVFAIVIKDELTRKKVKEAEKHEDVIEIYNKTKYDDFKKNVLDKIVSFAGSLPEIKLGVHENIHQFERDYKLKGWVRGDSLKGDEKLQEKHLELVEKNSQLELKIEKSKLKEKNRKTFKSGCTYKEIKELLESKEITIPKEYLDREEDVKFPLIQAFFLGKDTYSSGVSNRKGMNIDDKSLYFNVAPQLITLGLLENKENVGVEYRTTVLTEDGKKFITLYELEKMKNSLEQNV